MSPLYRENTVWAPAYDMGWCAFENDEDYDANPYSPKAQKAGYVLWQRGWSEASWSFYQEGSTGK